MTSWFISRHPGAVEWAKNHQVSFDKQIKHLDIDKIQKGDTVIGTLPVNIAAEVCERGAHYMHLCLKLPAHMRGRELGIDDLERYGAKLQIYGVTKEP